eukprot:Gregarina_sp_Poly_1__780@NODE_1187_length_4827_cov_61_777101_g816_i0_p2_GENE_NODE_1187_length_4827_cov_61_777101_g816_i0NODE_1187_length_4827_cov_61_777101_g816_i0_p2_ORF_typecomplete_len654_score140_86Utp14/PF04615_13/3_9e72HA/PF03457_14/3_2e02_NODE_1187_length_4827_cov_61_777101_g816_i026194580
MSQSLFQWDGAQQIPGSLKRRLIDIDSIAVPPAEEGAVAAAKRVRKLGLAEAERTLSKYVRQALRPDATKSNIYGAPDFKAVHGEDLTTPVTTRNALDRQLGQLFESLSRTQKGAEKQQEFFAAAANDAVTAQRKQQLMREAKGALFREYQRQKRLKKIKSKAFRKHRRADLEKQRIKTLERLEEEDPEEAARLREEYETKRAELRMQKSHRARKRWAHMAARFGGKEAERQIQGQFQAAKEQKDILDKLSGKKDFNNSDSGEDSESTTDDEDENITKEEQITQLVDKTAAEFLQVLEPENDLVPKGIRAMKFMQRGEARRKAELAAEAEEFLKLLEAGHSEADAKRIAKDKLRDDFDLGSNALPDVERVSIELAEKKKQVLRQQESKERRAQIGADPSKEENPSEIKHLEPEVLSNASSIPKDALSKPDKLVPLDAMQITDFLAAGTKIKSAGKSRGSSGDAADEAKVSDPVSVEQHADLSLLPAPERNYVLQQNDEGFRASNAEFVKLAFAITDTNLEEFYTKQAEERKEENEKSQGPNSAVPGWGSWAGEGIKPRLSNSRKNIAPVKKKNAVYNSESIRASAARYKPVTIPSHLTSRAQLDALMSQPIGKEWVPEGSYLKSISPEISVRSGTVVAPMKHKGPKHLRKGLS